MPIEQPTFSRVKHADFGKTLRSRINVYFKTHQKSRNANRTMVTKTVVMISLFFVPLVILASGFVSSGLVMFALYIVSGLGMAGIGMGVMHDAIHGSYSKNKRINTLLGYTFNMIGANATVWNIQHNILHHTYTNIEEADDDLNAPFFLRFSPHAKHYWVHQFQHIYIWFFYAISTISWITTKDFVRMKRYKDMGFLNKKNEYRKEVLSMTAWKLLYYSYALMLPMIVLPFAWWLVLLAFMSMHMVTGLMVSIVFQIAHIMPDNEFPLPDGNGSINDNWYSHQFATTTNFSPDSKLLFWLVGGLNYQIEHHVLPDVCHVHYKNLTELVKDTAKEYGLPYNSKPTMAKAIYDHFKMLQELGRKERLVPVQIQ
jgi:linoleoyl-CoA desaturase